MRRSQPVRARFAAASLGGAAGGAAIAVSSGATGGFCSWPKTSLSCCVTRTNVVRRGSSLSRDAPTYLRERERRRARDQE